MEEYYKTLKEVDKNLQEVKQKYHISGMIAGMDAQVEVKPQQGPFVGSERECPVRVPRHTMKWRANLRTCSWNGSRSMRSNLRTPCAKIGNRRGPGQTNWTSGSRVNNNCRSGRSLTTLRSHQVGGKKHCGKKLQGSKPYRSLTSDDLCKVAAKEKKLET